jgi:kinetochor protein Mis14/NSL1
MMSQQLHQKVHLVSEDVRWVKSQLTQALDAKINLHLPAGREDDPLRSQVQKQVSDFVAECLEMARHGLIVDGVDMSQRDSLEQSLTEAREEMEPFDGELNDRLRELYGRVDAETLQVTELRRRLPLETGRIYAERLQKEKLLLKETLASITSTKSAADKPMDVDEAELRRIQNDFDAVLQEVKSLKEVVPETYMGLERLRETIKYVRDS